jgi:hypothetical protein
MVRNGSVMGRSGMRTRKAEHDFWISLRHRRWILENGLPTKWASLGFTRYSDARSSSFSSSGNRALTVRRSLFRYSGPCSASHNSRIARLEDFTVFLTVRFAFLPEFEPVVRLVVIAWRASVPPTGRKIHHGFCRNPPDRSRSGSWTEDLWDNPIELVADCAFHILHPVAGIKLVLEVIGHDFKRVVTVVARRKVTSRVGHQESVRAKMLPLDHVDQFMEVERLIMYSACPHNRC